MINNQYYISVPNDLILDHNEYELVTFIALSMKRQLLDSDIAVTSVVDICKTINYSEDRRKDSYFSSIKTILVQFQKNSWIDKIALKNKKINPSELFKVRLGDYFNPQNNYTPITLQELNTILDCTEYKAKASLIRVFLYIKSFMYLRYNGNTDDIISAYYVAANVAVYALGITRGKYDLCVNVLCGLGLLVCHQTGSYYNQYGITNAPNVYVLNNKDTEHNISGAISRLKYDLLNPKYGNKDDFMPIVYIGKTIKRDKAESEFEDHIQDDEEDNGEWGDRNPMERNYYNYY